MNIVDHLDLLRELLILSRGIFKILDCIKKKKYLKVHTLYLDEVKFCYKAKL
jgi:hypothetical protein